MPYDPRMLQMAQRGIGMMGPEASPFDRTNQPRQWWGQPLPSPQQRPDDSNTPQPANQPKKPPSLLDMMMGVGRMTRPEYDRAIQGPGAYGVPPKDAARVNPWAFLGSMGMPAGGEYR